MNDARGGFGSPAPRFVAWCSIQLSYRHRVPVQAQRARDMVERSPRIGARVLVIEDVDLILVQHRARIVVFDYQNCIRCQQDPQRIQHLSLILDMRKDIREGDNPRLAVPRHQFFSKIRRQRIFEDSVPGSAGIRSEPAH